MNRILILGQRGYLGSAFAAAWAARRDVVLLDAERVDITRAWHVRRLIDDREPTLVLNAAGRTSGPGTGNIDGCESSFAARTETAAANIHGALIVRDVCADAGIPLVHLGSGCVFDGPGPFHEYDRPNPRSWYAETKAFGDRAVAHYNNALVVRFRMPFSGVAHPRNLLTKLQQYAAVVDAPNSVIEVASLIDVVDQLLAKGVRGIVHVAHPDPVSPYEVACRLTFPRGITPDELDLLTLAPRSNCVLATEKLAHYGITVGTAAAAVDRCLAQLGGTA